MLSHLGLILGPLGAILEPSLALLGPSWGFLGPSWEHPGSTWGLLGITLGSSRHILWLSWATLELAKAFLDQLVVLASIFGPSGPFSGSYLGHLEAFWEPS